MTLDPEAAHVPHALGGAYPARGGNAVRPLVDGAPAFRRIAEAVEGARASVWVTVAFVERDLRLPGARGPSSSIATSASSASSIRARATS